MHSKQLYLMNLFERTSGVSNTGIQRSFFTASFSSILWSFEVLVFGGVLIVLSSKQCCYDFVSHFGYQASLSCVKKYISFSVEQ